MSNLSLHSEKIWFVYLLECQNQQIYTGITTDVTRRYLDHCAGKGARYTRANPPIQLLMSFPCPDRSTASRLEYQIKKCSAAQKRHLILQFNEKGDVESVYAMLNV
jgi:putative endonuclease